MPGEHIEEYLLEQYAMDALPEQPRAALDEHLLGCADCQARLVQLDAFLSAFKPAILQMQEQPAARRNFFRLPRLVWLGSAAMVATCGLILMVRPAANTVAPAVIQMQALRGPEKAARLTAGQPAFLVFDVGGQAGPSKYEIEVVDRSGKEIWTDVVETKDDTLRIPARKLAPGSYWVRVYRDQIEKKLLGEYALLVVKP